MLNTFIKCFVRFFRLEKRQAWLCELDMVDSEDVEDTKADGDLWTEVVATEIDDGEEKLLGIQNI